MEFKFNSNDLVKIPKIAICRLDLQMLGYLNAVNIVIKPTAYALSELTFKVYEGSNFYDSVRKKMVLEVDGFGRFEIQKAEKMSDGSEEYKEVSAYSYEVSMNKVTLTYKEDTVFKLWDAISPQEIVTSNIVTIKDEYGKDKKVEVQVKRPTLLWIIHEQTGWNIKHVDESLMNSSRTMTIDNAQAYSLLAGDISDAFKCYFVFDTMTKEISVYERGSVTDITDIEARHVKNSGVNLSFRNLIKDIKISEASDDVVTALTVTGAEGVGINLVNPIGNNIIYDFSYYMNDKDWGMPKDLQDAIKDWLAKIEDKKESYANYVALRVRKSTEIQDVDVELYNANSDLKALMDAQSVDIAGGNDEGLAALYPRIKQKEDEVNALQMELDVNKKLLERYNEEVSAIVKELSFENNFTPEQIELLRYYTDGAVYSNENFVFTSTMSDARKIEIAQSLYNQGRLILDKLSKPLYEYECNIAGFMFDSDYEEFTNSLELGTLVNLEVEDGKWVEPKFMQAVIDFDNPDNTTIILSDSFRLLNDVYEFSDGYNQAVKAAHKTSLSAPLWDEPNNNGFFNTVNEYINNALNLANQEIVNATDQEFAMGSYGLRGRKFIKENNTYDPHQVAMTNNILAFTDDDWQSTRTALGRVDLGGVEYYGLVAEVLVGNLIAGSNLVIKNANKDEDVTFRVDGSGATLTNSSFTILKGDSTQIVINPEDGFKILKKEENVWKEILVEDTDGDIIANSIKLKSGEIGGWTIENNRLSNKAGDYIDADGTGKISLLTYDNKNAYFNGDIYANNLKWFWGESKEPSFIFSALGTMGGNWLTDGSVGKAKLNTLWVDEIDGMIAEFDEIKAKIITTDILQAGQIVAGEVVTPLVYGGTWKVFDGKGTNPNDNATIDGRKGYVSTEKPDVFNMCLSAYGNIYLNTGEFADVIVGHMGDDKRAVADGRLVAGSITTTNETINGTLMVDWIQLRNKLDHLKVSDSFKVECNATFDKDVTASGRLWINGGTAVTQNGQFWHGATRDIDIPGVGTLRFKDGLLV